MKAFISIVIIFAFAANSLILPIPPALALDPVSQCSPIACDACSKGALWGIFPNASIPHQASNVAAAACFTSYSPNATTIGCPCLFNAQTETPAIIGYQPNYIDQKVGAATTGYVQVVWTANLGSAVGGQMGVSVYSGWWSEQPGNIGQFPLIGSLGNLGVSAPTSDLYTISSTLPDPITLNVTVTKAPNGTVNNAPLLINLAATYGDQNITFGWPIPSTQSQTMQAPFKIATPPPGSEWWCTEGLKVPSKVPSAS